MSSTVLHVKPSVTAGLTLRANLAWTLAGTSFYTAAQWAVLVALAKFGTPAMVGELALGLAISAPIFLFATLRLRTIQGTDAGGEYITGDYLSLRAVTTLFALLVLLGIVLFGPYNRGTQLVILGVGVSKAFECGSDVLYGLFQQYEQMDRIATSLVARGALSMTVAVLLARLTANAGFAAAGLAAANALAFFVLDVPNASRLLHANGGKKLRARWHARTMMKLGMTALPLGISVMLMSFGSNVPRYFIARSLGDSQLGLFAAISYLVVPGSYVVSALAEAASPRLAKYYYAKARAAFSNLLGRLIVMALCAGVAGLLIAVAWGHSLLSFLYRPSFSSGSGLLMLLMAGAVFAYLASVLSYALVAIRRFRAHLAALVVMMATAACGCYYLIPRFGLAGAAWALLLGFCAQTIWSAAVVARHPTYAGAARGSI